jgi:mono/diheme cytochrome c family protein
MKHRYQLFVPRQLSLNTLLTFVLSLGFLFSFAEVDKAAWNEGKALFKGNCAACHNPKADGTGPALMGVTARWEGAGEFKGKSGKQWLYIWIKNYNDAVNGGYKYAVDMAASRPAAMNVFATLKDADIDKMLLYIENPDAYGAPAPTTATTAGTGEGNKGAESPSSTLYIFIFFLVVLVAILVGVTNKLDKIIAEKEGQPQVVKVPFYKRPNFVVALVLIAFVFLGYETVDWGTSLGRQQGYQPTQPIKYSHALHAGKHKIDCQYCHSTAYKGKHANIPSVNTCMNCHKNITKGPKYGTEEIAKIYEAVGWDAYTQSYSKPQKPVEWVRIHNLPDHVYFNHAQHVNAGKVQCQTCHGPIETMEEVYQYSPLSMGWCINCHRQTEVQFASNSYYSTYETLHEKLKNKELSKITVDKIGGTECQRCHY